MFPLLFSYLTSYFAFCMFSTLYFIFITLAGHTFDTDFFYVCLLLDLWSYVSERKETVLAHLTVLNIKYLYCVISNYDRT